MVFDLSGFDRDELVALAKNDLSKDLIEPALGKLKQAQKLDSSPDQVAALMAKIYAQLKLLDRASHLFQQYLEQFPNAINERFQLGMVRLESGEANEALQVWEPLLKADPTHPPALYYTAVALLELGRTADAKRNLDVLLKTAPADNLYFSRSKDLLSRIESNQPLPSADTDLVAELN